MAFLNPPSAPLFQRGERGDFCRCLAQKGDIEKYGSLYQKAKVLPEICIFVQSSAIVGRLLLLSNNPVVGFSNFRHFEF
jgi:hypothetical protein